MNIQAFDSVPHSWIIKALHLAKVRENVLNAILRLMELWATKVNLFAEGTNIETESEKSKKNLEHSYIPETKS